MFMREFPDLAEVPVDFLDPAELEVPTERLTEETDLAEVPADFLEPAELEVPTERFSMDFPEVPEDFLDPAELEVPTERFSVLKDFPEVPADFLDPAELEVPTERLIEETDLAEVPADFLEPAELEVPRDMFMRDLPDEADFLETESTDFLETDSDFFPKRVSQKESFWRDFLDGELDLLESLSRSSSRLRRMTLTEELDLVFLAIFLAFLMIILTLSSDMFMRSLECFLPLLAFLTFL